MAGVLVEGSWTWGSWVEWRPDRGGIDFRLQTPLEAAACTMLYRCRCLIDLAPLATDVSTVQREIRDI